MLYNENIQSYKDKNIRTIKKKKKKYRTKIIRKDFIKKHVTIQRKIDKNFFYCFA